MKKQTNNNKHDLLQKAFNHAIFYLKFRPRSKKEVKENLNKYLSKFKLSTEICNSILNQTLTRLTQLQFIDDSAFTKYWVDQRQTSRPKGERVIRHELKFKGIDNEIIDKVIEEQLTKTSQKEVLEKLINKAIVKYKNLPFIKRKQKIVEYLFRRGYLYTEISSLVDESLKKQ